MGRDSVGQNNEFAQFSANIILVNIPQIGSYYYAKRTRYIVFHRFRTVNCAK